MSERKRMEKERDNWKMAIGLGNPGPAYSRTYHNAGAMAIEVVADGSHGFKKPFSVFRGKPFSYLKIGDIILVKPDTFMNESGKAAASAARHFGIKPEEIVVLHDDSDLAIGSYRCEFGRGSAGHNGVSSVIKSLGTKDIWRIRIGVRNEKEMAKAGDFVLKKMGAEDKAALSNALLDLKARYFEGHDE